MTDHELLEEIDESAACIGIDLADLESHETEQYKGGTMKRFGQINFSPFATNMLDKIGVPLVTKHGDSVLIRRGGSGGLYFIVEVNGKKAMESMDNLEVSCYLNSCLLYTSPSPRDS